MAGGGEGDVIVRGVHAATQMRSALNIDSATAGYGGLVIHGGNSVLVEDGALVACRTGVVGGIGAGTGAGIVRVRGASEGFAAQWHSSSELSVGHSSAPGSTGILTVDPDGAVTIGAIEPLPGWVRIGSGGTLSGHGLVEALGGVDVAGGVDNFAGLVAPGNSPGTLTIDGDYIQGAAGVLEIEFRGSAASADYDQLVVVGSAVFEPGAKIRFVLIDPNPDDGLEEVFLPRTGETFEFLVADAIELPAGLALNDLIEIDGLPANVAMDLRLEVGEGSTRITAAAQRVDYAGPPPAITEIAWSTLGLDCELAITEPAPGYAYILETSVDLKTWTTALGRISGGGIHFFTDRNAWLRPVLFYRVAVPGTDDP